MATAKKLKPPKPKSVILGGGLDTVTPPLKIEPGKIIQCRNFECDLNRGYRLMEGYERFDGLDSPVDTDWYALNLTVDTDAVSGDTVTGDTSGATGELIQAPDAGYGCYIVLTSTTPFSSAEGFTANTGTIGSTGLNAVLQGSADALNDIRLVKENYLRDKISTVPGTGSVLGVWRHLDTTIAFRNKSGNATAGMYKATTSGWTEVSLGHIVFFDTASNSANAAVGTTIDDGAGNSATIEAAVYNVLTNDDLGYYVLSGYTAGFAISANMTISAVASGTVTVAAAALTLQPYGDFEFRSHNFTGSAELGATDPRNAFGVDGTGSYNVYGVDGVNPAFEYWPARNIYVPIYSDMATSATRALDIPTFVGIYKNQLWLLFARGITRNSDTGKQYDFDAASGTVEIGLGSTPTGVREAPASLVITTSRKTFAVTGTTINNFELQTISENTGSIAHTLQQIGTNFMVDDRGIIDQRRVQAFGDFESATVSRNIQKEINAFKSTIIGSCVSLKKNIYRFITSAGEGVSMTIEFDERLQRDKFSFGLFDLETNVTCISNAEDASGANRIFFGNDQGYVFEWDKGRSFDGEIRQSWLQFAYHFLGSPTMRKRFRRMFMNVQVDGTASIGTIATYSLGSSDVKPHSIANDTIEALADLNSAFDVARWDVATFDGSVLISDSYGDLEGTGDAIGINLSHVSATDDIFSIQDVTYYYSDRRAMRGAR